MDENIRMLYREFNRIKKLEYVKSVRGGNTGVGATFEALLNKNEDDLEIPDFYGIEIKTRRSYSKAYITLFSAVPTGSGYYEVKRLRDTYGYRDSRDCNLKVLNVDVFSDSFTKVGNGYYFKLYVDRDSERIILLVFDRYKNLVDDSTYWDFFVLKEKLERKLEVLAVVKAWPNRIGGYEYFKYYKMSIYILKGFDYFVRCIEEGIIKLNLKISSYRDFKRYGMVKSHGVSFCIREEDLDSLFDIYR